MFTIRPQPCFLISGIAAEVVWNAALRLIAMTASHISGGKLFNRRDVLDASIVHEYIHRPKSLCCHRHTSAECSFAMLSAIA